MARVFYELTLDGDNLKAKVIEPFEFKYEEVCDSTAEYFNGREFFLFLKKCTNKEVVAETKDDPNFTNYSDCIYGVVWCQDILCHDGKLFMDLLEEECLTSAEPIDRFSWRDDEDNMLPNHQIILEK